MKENYCRKNTTHNLLLARNDRRRSFIPMVVYGRQEQLPGAFLLLNRYRTGLKTGEELPSNSYYPMSILHIKSRFRFENILSLLNFFAMLEGIVNTDSPRGWYHFPLSGGSVYIWYWNTEYLLVPSLISIDSNCFIRQFIGDAGQQRGFSCLSGTIQNNKLLSLYQFIQNAFSQVSLYPHRANIANISGMPYKFTWIFTVRQNNYVSDHKYSSKNT